MREEWRKIDTGVCSSGARMKALEIPANLSRRFSLHFPADYLRSPPLAPFPHHADRNSARWGTFQICFRGRGRGGRFCNRGCGFEKSVCHAHGSIRFPRNLLPSFYLHRVLPLLSSPLLLLLLHSFGIANRCHTRGTSIFPNGYPARGQILSTQISGESNDNVRVSVHVSRWGGSGGKGGEEVGTAVSRSRRETIFTVDVGLFINP